MASPDYPLTLRLHRRPVLVVGGGTVGARRATALHAAGADVTVVDPAPSAALAGELPELVRRGEIVHHQRGFGAADVEAVWLVHAATSDPVVNAAVVVACEARGVWCVRADDGEHSPAVTPAVARGAEVTVAVTGGGDPGRARSVRDAIAELLAGGRLAGGQLTDDRPGGSRLPLAATRAPRPGSTGHVALVGGGPGDPGLITVRGQQLLAAADVVVVDKLAPRALLETLAPEVNIIDAGKAPHAHNMSQEQINDTLIEHARAGRRVVRLKGGDPFVFGRGGEELLACAAAGIRVEVVPGVSSAIAVPAVAGIPVTHRGSAQEFTVVSAHVEPGHADSTVDWAALARLRGTLVLLMAVGRLPAITAELLARGKDPATPAAVVAAGTTAHQQVIRASLADLAGAAAGLAPPAVVVIGDVVGCLPEPPW